MAGKRKTHSSSFLIQVYNCWHKEVQKLVRYSKSFGGLRLRRSLTTSTLPAPWPFAVLTSLLSPGAGGTHPLGTVHLCPGPASCPWVFLSHIITHSLGHSCAHICHLQDCSMHYHWWSVKEQREQDLHLLFSSLSETLALRQAMLPVIVLSLASWTLQTNGYTNPDTYLSSFCTQIEKTGKSKSNSALGELSHDHPTCTVHGMVLRDVIEHCQAEEGMELHLSPPGIEDFMWNTTVSS